MGSNRGSSVDRSSGPHSSPLAYAGGWELRTLQLVGPFVHSQPKELFFALLAIYKGYGETDSS
jgi:hypothetical protein